MKRDDIPTFVVADPNRICPVFAGPAMIRGGRLRLRLPDREAEVVAPASLLAHVFEVCDGTRTLAEIVAGESRRAPQIGVFIADLLDQGVLIDASVWLAHAARVARQPQAWGRPASSAAWGAADRAPSLPAERTVMPLTTKLADRLVARRSARNFSDAPVSEEQLAALVWAMYGAVRRADGSIGRSVASAGAFHSLQLRLVLLKDCGTLAAGVYRLDFPESGAVGFTRLGDLGENLARALVQPDLIDRAAGIIVIAADPQLPALKYRNRGFAFQLLEAGQALQNAALAAVELDLGMCDLGGYDDDRLAALCRFGDLPLLAAAVFGTRADAARATAVEASLPIDFRWLECPGEMPGFLARARVRGDELGEESWGHAADAAAARTKAVAEAVERHAWRHPRGLVMARRDELPNAVDPRTLISWSAAQYRRADFPFAAFDPGRPYHWKAARGWPDGAEHHVLADCVHAAEALAGPRRFVASTTSGCAAAVSFDEAVLRGVLELIERDALMRAWVAQRGGTALDPHRLPDDLAARIHRLESTGAGVSVQILPSTLAAIALVGVRHEGDGFTCCGSAADFSAAAAIDRALAEAEIAAWARLAGHRSPPVKPRAVASPVEHAALYAQRAWFRRADRLFAATGHAALVDVAGHAHDRDQLLAALHAQGRRILAVNLTLPGATLTPGGAPLHVARAFVPGLVPITFGHGRLPCAMTGPLAPGADFPHPFS